MSNKKSIMITCKEATMLISMRDEQALSRLEKFKLKLHLLLCKTCFYFAKHVEILQKSIKKLTEDNTIAFTDEKKTALEKLIKENL
jgi:hypothetical protein